MCTKQSNKNKTPSRESKHLNLQKRNFWEAGPKGVHCSILSAGFGHVQEKGKRKHARKRCKGGGEMESDCWFAVFPSWVNHNSRPGGRDPGCWTQYTHSICSGRKHFSVSYKALLCFSKRAISIWENAKILQWPFNLCILTFCNNYSPWSKDKPYPTHTNQFITLQTKLQIRGLRTPGIMQYNLSSSNFHPEFANL